MRITGHCTFIGMDYWSVQAIGLHRRDLKLNHFSINHLQVTSSFLQLSIAVRVEG